MKRIESLPSPQDTRQEPALPEREVDCGEPCNAATVKAAGDCCAAGSQCGSGAQPGTETVRHDRPNSSKNSSNSSWNDGSHHEAHEHSHNDSNGASHVQPRDHRHNDGHTDGHSHGHKQGHKHAGNHSHSLAHGPDNHGHDPAPAQAAFPTVPAAAGCGACCARAPAATAPEPAPDDLPSGARMIRYRIDAMDCPTEESLIRGKLGGMAGVAGLQFNLMQRVLTVWHTLESPAPLASAIETLGMKPVALPGDGNAGTPAAQAANAPAATPWWPLAAGGVAALGAELAELFAPTLSWLPAVFALCAIALAGTTTYRKGWIAIRNRNLNINALMSIAVTGALLIGEWPEAAMVMVLFAIAERIEAASLDRARNAIRGLMALAPEQATVRQADGEWATVPAATVPVGAAIRLRPGERVALDGEIVSGISALDQSPITGESVPVDKQPGDPVFAGSINQTGELEYRATALASDSTLARIIHAVEAAQGSRAPTQRFVDQFARIYTPAVFAIALLVAVLPPLWLQTGWIDSIYKALVLLVIACPCALVISTPVTIVSALTAAARRGILIKGGAYLEQGRKLRWLALDKTGTLTHGRPAQTDAIVLAGDPDRTRAIAASLAARSDHPVSRAVAAAASDDRIPLADVDRFEAIPGMGVRGHVGGMGYVLGNHRLIHDTGLCSPALEARLETMEREGKTLVLLADGNRVLAVFGVADTVRDTSREAIAELHALGVRTLMLSGDNPHTVQAIAAAVGIDEARGGQLPQDKADAVAALAARQAGGGVVGMVGDGVNDAPALARSDIGFAMGAAGTDTAIETADVALMDDDLRKIPAFVRLSRRTGVILTQNIALALGIKAAFLLLTAFGLGTMWMAVFADMGAALIVVFNGLRLLRG